MSAQTMLTGLLVHSRSGAEAEQTAKQLLAVHAHELAEKIRALPAAGYWSCCGSELHDAADLIDPEVSAHEHDTP